MFTGSSQLGWVSKFVFLQLDDEAHNAHFAPGTCTSAFSLVPVDMIVLDCAARLVWMPEPSSLSISAYLSQGCGATGACPGITWTKLGVTFKRQTCPVWKQTVDGRHTNPRYTKRLSSGAAAHTNLLWMHLGCSSSLHLRCHWNRRDTAAADLRAKTHCIHPIPCSHTSTVRQRTFVSADCFNQS